MTAAPQPKPTSPAEANEKAPRPHWKRHSKVSLSAYVWNDSDADGLVEVHIPHVVEFRFAEGSTPMLTIPAERIVDNAQAPPPAEPPTLLKFMRKLFAKHKPNSPCAGMGCTCGTIENHADWYEHALDLVAARTAPPSDAPAPPAKETP